MKTVTPKRRPPFYVKTGNPPGPVPMDESKRLHNQICFGIDDTDMMRFIRHKRGSESRHTVVRRFAKERLSEVEKSEAADEMKELKEKQIEDEKRFINTQHRKGWK